MSTGIPYLGPNGEVWDFFVGCEPVSSGCANCWAPGLCGGRLSHLPGYGDVVKKVDGRWKWNGVVRKVGDLNKPQWWRKPRVIFVQSKSDLFYPMDAPWYFDWVVDTARNEDRHTYLILTKRPQIMADCVAALKEPLPPNVWLGVSVEDQPTADERLPILCRIPCAHRWIIYEPALGPVELYMGWFGKNGLRLKWIVAGCESGPNRRPAKLDWFRDIRDQCSVAGAPYYFKQAEVNGKVVTLPLLDGVRHDATPWEPPTRLMNSDEIREVLNEQ